MKNIAVVALLSALVATPAIAADDHGNYGIDFSVDSVLGIHGEWDVSSMANNHPVSVQAFLKNYSQYMGPGVDWGTTGIGVAGIYDFSTMAKLHKRILPYAGAGLVYVNYNWHGWGPEPPYNGVGSGLYVTAGFRFVLTPRVAADFNYNNFGSWTAGVNFGF